MWPRTDPTEKKESRITTQLNSTDYNTELPNSLPASLLQAVLTELYLPHLSLISRFIDKGQPAQIRLPLNSSRDTYDRQHHLAH